MKMNNTVWGEDAEICGKVAYICGLFVAFSHIKNKSLKFDKVEEKIKNSDLFEEEEIECFIKGGLEELCHYYELDDEFEGTLMCFMNQQN